MVTDDNGAWRARKAAEFLRRYAQNAEVEGDRLREAWLAGHLAEVFDEVANGNGLDLLWDKLVGLADLIAEEDDFGEGHKRIGAEAENDG